MKLFVKGMGEFNKSCTFSKKLIVTVYIMSFMGRLYVHSNETNPE